MASFSVSASLGGTSETFSVSPSDARMTEFLDDLRNIHYPPGDDGNPLSRAEVASKWINDLGAGQVAFAKALKQRRLDAAVAEADDLEGNT